MSKGVQKVVFDLVGFLKDITSDDSWEETDGPDSGMGLDYFYKNHDEQMAYINIDQDYMTITVDEDVVYEGSCEEAQVA